MKENLQTLSVEELVKAFVGFALQQDMALFDDDIREVNRLFFKLESVEAELKSRPGDQRSALLPLFEHPNPQVQVKAAKATLAIAPVAARHVLQTIEETCHGPQQLEAGMSLLNLERGVFKPI
jgi:cytochrome c oxidase assembly protein Cox11